MRINKYIRCLWERINQNARHQNGKAIDSKTLSYCSAHHITFAHTQYPRANPTNTYTDKHYIHVCMCLLREAYLRMQAVLNTQSYRNTRLAALRYTDDTLPPPPAKLTVVYSWWTNHNTLTERTEVSHIASLILAVFSTKNWLAWCVCKTWYAIPLSALSRLQVVRLYLYLFQFVVLESSIFF